MLQRVVAFVTGLVGVAILPASLLPGWVDTERVIVGYGTARVIWTKDAWAGFFLPWLPAAVLLTVGAGVLVAVGASRERRALTLAGIVAAVAAVGTFGGALLIGSESQTPTFAVTWTGEPGYLLVGGLVAAGVVAAAGLLSTMARSARVAAGAAVAALAMAVVLGACGGEAGPTPTAPSSPSVPAAGIPDWRTDPDEPYPFTTPVPELVATEIDGSYTRPRTDEYEGERAACRRCPPFPPDRGESILSFDRGRYEIVHEEPAYRSFGHYTWDGERLSLFNDPECSGVLGVYDVERDGAEIRLKAVDDPCAFDQRARDLTDRTWTPVEIARGESCQPPNTEAAISGHWPEPSGC